MKELEIVSKGKLKFGATKAQLSTLKSFSNVEIAMFDNRFFNYISKEQASQAIESAKNGIKVIIK